MLGERHSAVAEASEDVAGNLKGNNKHKLKAEGKEPVDQEDLEEMAQRVSAVKDLNDFKASHLKL